MKINSAADVHGSRAVWRTSSYSQGNGACVEVADGMGSVLPVRDSKDGSRSPLVFSSAAWTAFVGAVKENDTSR